VNVKEMLRKISYRQFIEWRIFATLEPFDETRQDYRIASIVATLVNVNRGKGRKAVSVEEMRLKFGDLELPKQSIIEQIAVGKMLADLYNSEQDAKDQKRKAADDRRKSRHTVR
jgi:hypothetical protein